MSYLQQRLNGEHRIDTVLDGSEASVSGVKVSNTYKVILNNVLKYRHAFSHFERYIASNLFDTSRKAAYACQQKCEAETMKLAGQNSLRNETLFNQCHATCYNIVMSADSFNEVLF
jgi:hypothetical protein